MSAPVEDLLARYGGEIVPQSFNPGFAALSYVVSLIGASCTLELLNRRTSHKGRFNHLLLIGSAVAMGGISIWCMHFIGNRAIDLAQSQPELQIAYSSSFTALSFFVPIIVLLAAFLAVGSNNVVSWWRVTIGGVLAGAAICGMHYLGNNSIENYVCVYRPINVVGSAIIAVAASIVSLALFFVFRASWTNAWWKRAACSVVLAGAVSGMHWCAATGTRYRLVNLSTANNELSRNMTVIVVICLSILACCIMGGVAIYTTRVMRRYANKAQQVVLAAAVFDKDGRILVNPDGLIPSEQITDSFIEKGANDTFSIAHPLFHWMFKASRNWTAVSSLVSGMANHLMNMPRATARERESRTAVDLLDQDGEMIIDYEIVIRELFCVAAAGLAEKMKDTLPSVGVLWDEILPTGGRQQKSSYGQRKDTTLNEDDLAEKGASRRKQEFGRGSLMFLVRRVQNERDVSKLEAAGFRFAELRQVSGIIGSSMQVQCWDFEAKLRGMSSYADDMNNLEHGVHVGFFGIRARVGSYGFDVLVRKGARNLLPSVQLPAERLEAWHLELLQQLDGLTVTALSTRLKALQRLSTRDMLFTTQLSDGIDLLRSAIEDPIFEEAVLSAKVVTLPTHVREGKAPGQQAATMISLWLVIPIHVKVTSAKCEFVPLSFFKTHQVISENGMHQLTFAQSVHREFGPFAQSRPKKPWTSTQTRRQSSFHGSPVSSRIRRLGRLGNAAYAVDGEGNPIPTTLGRPSSPGHSNDTGSTLKLWPKGRRNSDNNSANSSLDAPPTYTSQEGAAQQSAFGGIMVSEEIRVEIHDAGELTAPLPVQGRSPSHGSQVSAPARGNARRQGAESSSGAIHRATTVTADGDARRSMPGSAPIEMRSLAHPGDRNVHTGAAPFVSNVEADRPRDAPTFVDELFAICIDGR